MTVLTVLSAATFVAVFTPARVKAQRDAGLRPQVIPACQESLRTGEVSRRCFEALAESPDVAAALNVVPGIADGRLSIAEVSRSLLIAESVPPSREPGEEPDPDEVAFIDRGVLQELRSTPQREMVREVFTRAGPISTESFVHPSDGFPFIPIPDNKNYLDIPAFTLDLHNTLAANVNGYAIRVRQNGVTVATGYWDWARNPVPADAPALAWNTNQRIHLVSLSKFMTAVGLVKLLKQKKFPRSPRSSVGCPPTGTPARTWVSSISKTS